MNKLEIVLDSREVAAMVDKEHSKLLRDIRTYIEQMDEANKKAFEEGKGAEAKIGLGDFFKESSYLDANNQSRPCYQITKKGCEFIANKLTGVKGTEFTVRYINRFHEMEDALEGERNIYKVKDTSLGEITSFVREMDKVMRDFGYCGSIQRSLWTIRHKAPEKFCPRTTSDRNKLFSSFF